jgi:predicted phage baseplate assembly protein
VGAGTISHIALPSLLAPDVVAVRNPLPAQGGQRREELETARLHAPNSHRIQERAVTAADYEMIARRHPDVIQAIADLRQVGSWTTAVVYIQPRHQLDLDTAFKAQMQAYFKPYQIMGYELSLRGPQYVPLSIRLRVTLLPNHHARTVERDLHRALGSQRFGQGETGFFHPARLTFGQPIYLSQVIARAMAVPGVQEVFVSEFRRLEEPEGMVATPAITIQRREIARLDADSQQPFHGELVIEMEGGLQ